MERKNKKPLPNYKTYQPHLKPIDTPKGAKIARVNKWLNHHQKIVLGALIAIALIIGGLFVFLFSGLTFEVVKDVSVHKKATPKTYSPLTGKETSEADSKRVVTAVIIENSPDARPQSGLKNSGVVFEAIAEGGITRFLTLYQEDQPQLIGPVRSLRPYYIDWLAAFDPAVAHVGGSHSALQEIRNGSYRDIDQFSNADTYWRAKDRYAPHNVYTNFENLNKINAKKGYDSSTFTGFVRKEDTKKPETTPATAITVAISSPLYNSSYTYNSETNSYMRSQAGQPHIDRESGQINPKVIVVLEATHSTVQEDGARESIQTTGSGKATIFQDGNVITGTWSKLNKKSQITFKDAEEKEVALNRGQTWITVVPTGKTPTWH